jgi:parallel beta-helix repeat protein
MPLLIIAAILLSAGDRTPELQRQIDRCRTGGTVTFAPGVYSVATLRLKSECSYRGTPGETVLKLEAKNAFIADVSEKSGIELNGITFDANNLGGAILAQGYAPVRNLRVVNCEFRNVTAASVYPANLTVFSSWGIIDSEFTNNRFENVSGGISLTTVQNVSLIGNKFKDVTQSDAIFIAPNPVSFPSGDNLHIEGNAVDGVNKIGIEIFRPDPPNGSRLTAPIIRGNTVARLTAHDNEGMGLSITHGDGATIDNNTVDNTAGLPQQNGIGIEVIVRNGRVEHNRVVNGVGYGIAVQGTPGSIISDNTIIGARVDGIRFACDRGRNRCDSSDSVVEGNTITNAHTAGIDFDNNWSRSRVVNNTISRAPGAWPDDSRVVFTGIRAPAPPAPSELRANKIVQTAPGPPGFHFREIEPGK